jgi:hypothetical protein
MLATAILLDLTVKEVLGGIPHDGGALVAYALLLVFVGLTVLGSRRKGA